MAELLIQMREGTVPLTGVAARKSSLASLTSQLCERPEGALIRLSDILDGSWIILSNILECV